MQNSINNDSNNNTQIEPSQASLSKSEKIKKYFKQDSNIQQFPAKIIQQILDGVDLHLEDTCYKIQKWPQIFSMMIKCNASYITLRNNQLVTIFKQIQQVKFSNLKMLYLHHNNINNLQALCFCDFQLQDLALDNNHISRVNCLHKWLNVSHLTWFSLDNNPINSLQFLQKINMKLQEFRYIRIQTSNKKKANHEDLSILIKLKTKLLNLISICRSIRIKQDKIQNKIRHKYQNFMIC